MSNTRMAILKDTSLCVACYACRVACQNHNGLPENQKYLSLQFQEKGTFPNAEQHIARKSCMHCGDAPCAEICPVGVLHTNRQGFVNYIDNTDENCVGCRLCVNACPYDIPEIADGKMYKCTGCEELVAAGQEPACVDTCIANALTYGTFDEMAAKANSRLARIRTKYPAANLYGVDSHGGLGMLTILRTNPSDFGLS
ncbi:MAG: 4Fe-4S binding protein [Defluviitaleaceae bacterium]|nr:4Fe-4S binding protein [Defluviitaleaceae bacterium]